MEQPVMILIANNWMETPVKMSVKNPFNGLVVADICRGTEHEMDLALRAADVAFETARRMPAFERAAVLKSTAAGLRTHADDLARTIMLESGKPIRDARVEVERAAVTFDLGAGEAERLGGEILPLDIHPGSGRRTAWVGRFPVGPVLAVTPFNFPLNLAAHKVAPAVAAGCPVILKPSSSTPLTALKLGRIMIDAGISPGMLNIVPCSPGVAERAAADPRIKLLTFTGGSETGWHLKSRAGKKRVALELGGNAAAVIEPDCDLDRAISRCVTGGYAFSGQICISLQRIYIHESLFKQFKTGFIEKVRDLPTGDPALPDTRIGPMIDLKSAEQAHRRILTACEAGATAEIEVRREDNFLYPTILTGVDPESEVSREELFAPVTVLASYGEYAVALEMVNDSRFGLQAGIFTNRWDRIWQAYRDLQVGGVIVGDVPTVRVDNYPYGGVRDSGTGREGVRYAMEEMTERKVLVLPAD